MDEIHCTMDVNGILAWVLNTPEVVRTSELRAMVKVAHRETWRAWFNAPDGAAYGMRMRFSNRAFSILNLTPRSEKYRNRQRSQLGKVLPWVSPRGGMGRADHMYKLVTVEGTGWNPKTRGTTEIHSKASVPGSRILNFLGGKKSVYADEFYRVAEHKADANFLTTTLNHNMTEMYYSLIARTRGMKAKVA